MNLELRHEPAREQAPLAEPDFARWRSEDGEVRATFHRVPEGFLVRFLDRADFSIALDAGVVTCRPAVGSSRAVRDLYLNQILPMIRGHLGELVLHASAVAIDGGAVAFVAPTGRGKSTLAAAFARAGMPFLSDDGLSVHQEESGYAARPNRPSFRLWQDSEAIVLGSEMPEEYEDDKSRVEASPALPFQPEPLPLRAMYFLGAGDSAEPSITELPALDIVAELMNHTFFLDAEDRSRMKRHLDVLTRLAEAVPGYALDFPRDYERLPDVIAAVSIHMSERRGGSIELA